MRAQRAIASNENVTNVSDFSDVRKHWFEHPYQNNVLNDRPNVSNLIWNSSCKGDSNQISNFGSLGDLLLQNFNLQGSNFIPQNVHVRDLTLFYRKENVFYQMTAVWERAFPAIYKIDFFRSSDETFQKDVEKTVLPSDIQEGPWDIASVEQIFLEQLKKEKSLGAQEGSRIVTVEIPGRNQQEFNEVTYYNSIPISYNSDKNICRYDFKSRTAHCFCGFSNQKIRD
jgi:hypothetical protein